MQIVHGFGVRLEKRLSCFNKKAAGTKVYLGEEISILTFKNSFNFRYREADFIFWQKSFRSGQNR